jgi:hypothetical protein
VCAPPTNTSGSPDGTPVEFPNRKLSGSSTDNTIVKPPSDIIARQLGESAVLIRMRTSRIYELNETGARIWELLKQSADRDSVVDSLIAEFHIERAEAESAVDALIATLRAEGLV